MSDRQVRVFATWDYFVMWEKVGPFYRVTFVIDHSEPTYRRWFLTRAAALQKFDWAVRFAAFIARSDD